MCIGSTHWLKVGRGISFLENLLGLNHWYQFQIIFATVLLELNRVVESPPDL